MSYVFITPFILSMIKIIGALPPIENCSVLHRRTVNIFSRIYVYMLKI